MKVALPVKYMQDTWALNSDGEIDQELGETMDISNGGLAIYMNRWFDVERPHFHPSQNRNCRRRSSGARGGWRDLLDERGTQGRKLPAM